MGTFLVIYFSCQCAFNDIFSISSKVVNIIMPLCYLKNYFMLRLICKMRMSKWEKVVPILFN